MAITLSRLFIVECICDGEGSVKRKRVPLKHKY
jgi:hypothetical protein